MGSRAGSFLVGEVLLNHVGRLFPSSEAEILLLGLLVVILNREIMYLPWSGNGLQLRHEVRVIGQFVAGCPETASVLGSHVNEGGGVGVVLGGSRTGGEGASEV